MAEQTQDRRERKRLKRQKHIVSIAMRLFMQQGFKKTTMEQIADEADIAKATLYKYFPVKEAIIASYWQQRSLDVRQNIDENISKYPDIRSLFNASFKEAMNGIMQSRELYRIYIGFRLQHFFDSDVHEEMRSGSEENLTRIIEAGRKSGEIRKDIPVPVLVGNLELLFVMQAVSWLCDPDNYSPDHAIDTILDLFFNGAVANEKQQCGNRTKRSD